MDSPTAAEIAARTRAAVANRLPIGVLVGPSEAAWLIEGLPSVPASVLLVAVAGLEETDGTQTDEIERVGHEWIGRAGCRCSRGCRLSICGEICIQINESTITANQAART